MLDVTKDKFMSDADRMRMVELFVKYFGLKGKMVDPVKRSVALVWKMLLSNKSGINDKSFKMTEEMFVRQLWVSYTLRKPMLFATIMKITDLLLYVIDNNKDGYISFPEWDFLFKIFGISDQRVTYFLFKFTKPNFWGYSSILCARRFIVNLFLDPNPHYFFKFNSILQPTNVASKEVKAKPVNGINGNRNGSGKGKGKVSPPK